MGCLYICEWWILFKADDNNLISFGAGATGGDGVSSTNFVLRAENVYMSGSKVNMLTERFFLGSGTQYISGSNGNLKIFATGDTTISGSSVNIETPSFFMGATGSAFISGSDAKMQISSSQFHIKPDGSAIFGGDLSAATGTFGGSISVGSNFSVNAAGNVTASNIRLSGDVTATNITATGTGNIAGFTLDSGHLTATNFRLDSADATLSIGTGTDSFGSTNRIYLDGDGAKVSFGTNFKFNEVGTGVLEVSGSGIVLGAPSFRLGSSANYISGSGGDLKIYSTGTTELSGSAIKLLTSNFLMGSSGSTGHSGAYISGSGGNLEISSSKFHLQSDGELIVRKVDAEEGTIGGYNIGATKLYSDAIDELSPGQPYVTSSILLDTNTGNVIPAIGLTSRSGSLGAGWSVLAKPGATEIGVDWRIGRATSNGIAGTTGGLRSYALQKSDGTDVLVFYSDGGGYNTGMTSTTATAGIYFDRGQAAANVFRFQMGKQSGAHLKFNSAENLLYISSSNVFMGSTGSAYISASNGNMQISSSKFQIKPSGDLIVRKVDAEEGTIGGFTIAGSAGKLTAGTTYVSTISGSGIIYAGGATPGERNTAWMGFLDGNGNRIVSSSWATATKTGDFIGGTSEAAHQKPKWGTSNPIVGFAINPGNYWVNQLGYGATTESYWRVGSQAAGRPYMFYDGKNDGLVISGSGLDIEAWGGGAPSGYENKIHFSGSNVNLETPAFFMGATGSAYISGSTGKVEISSSKFHMKSSGDLILQGDISADTITANTAGLLAGFRLGANILESTGSAGVGVKIDTSTTNTINIGDFDAQHMLLDGANSNVKFYDSSNTEIVHIGSGITQNYSGYGHGIRILKGALIVEETAAVVDQIAPSFEVRTIRESDREADAYSAFFRMAANNNTSYNVKIDSYGNDSDFSVNHYNLHSSVQGSNYRSATNTYGIYSKVNGVGTTGTGYGGYFSAQQYNSVQPTNLYGLYVTTGVADNTYGVYIDADAGYGLYVADGESYFHENITIASGQYIYPNGTSDTNTFIQGSSNDLYIAANDDLYLRPDDDIRIECGTTEYVRFEGTNQRVGIGSTAPAQKLDVFPDENESAQIGKAHVGYIGHSDYAGFSHVDSDSTTGYALLQHTGGTTYLNAATGTTIHHRINNTSIMGMTATGLAVGGTSPSYALDVTGTARFSSGILFGSDTAAENTLHDYEEGTWTPTLNASGTATIAGANYIKIGSLVSVWAQLQLIQESGTQTLDFKVGGLPYAVTANNVGGTCMIHGVNVPSTTYQVTCWAITTEEVMFYESVDNAGWDPIEWEDLGDNDYIYFQISYSTTS